ncbi:glycosyltransferase [Desulfocurvus vexinensis]|uniref:glycosyltransferase n=1 Tax=Desulfocurvus vexinensis TaxID=399548 RepID=UPI0004B0F94E|nr:glycosyltransferase [Desulfocurvus vexinensis]
MKVLLTHPNFPGQLRHVAAALGSRPDNVVVFAASTPRNDWRIPGVSKLRYVPQAADGLTPHRLVGPVQEAVLQGEALHRAAHGLKSRGFRPDVIYGNSGWGSTLYLKDVWPDVPLMCYFEWFYDPLGADARFEERPGADARYEPPKLMRTRNAVIFNDLWACDQGLSPTRWQWSQFPQAFRPKIEVLHDGVDTEFFSPAPGAPPGLDLPGADLTGVDEIVTFAGRGMEPYRGFPQFMEAAALVLARRPRAHVVVAGSERVCYGAPREDGKTWKEHMLEVLDLDRERLHFVGSLPYGRYRDLLRASSVHVYLTRPFVLSWSFIEAMACGCALAASDTEPVREVVAHGQSALLCDFFRPAQFAEAICTLLDDRALAARLGAAARQTALERYDLKTLLPRHLELLRRTARLPRNRRG